MILWIRRKKIGLYIVFVLLLCIVVGAASYAYIVARTSEGNVDNNSGKVDVDYTITENITGIQLMPSEDKSGGLHSVATAKINSGSVPSAFNIYITPTSITGLNIAALKWEVVGTYNGTTVYSKNGNFSTAVKDTPITIVDKYELKSTNTTFDIYIWLDANLINTALNDNRFTAKISADTVQITGSY